MNYSKNKIKNFDFVYKIEVIIFSEDIEIIKKLNHSQKLKKIKDDIQ
jgi:hypothetical protein